MGERPFALFLTWTTYGTWLPGDARGYVSDTRSADGDFQQRQNRPHTPYRRDDEGTRRNARTAQKHDTVRLTPAEAQVAAVVLAEIAVERTWRIARGAVMTNHVHLVLFDTPDDGPAVRRMLKGVSQQGMSDRLAGHSRRWWTAGGSDRYLKDDRSILGALAYVENQPGMLASIVENRVFF